jgi:hypothetical protein
VSQVSQPFPLGRDQEDGQFEVVCVHRKTPATPASDQTIAWRFCPAFPPRLAVRTQIAAVQVQRGCMFAGVS